MKQKLLNLAAALLLCSASASAQTNLVANWDGGTDTSSPSNFGWTSSANRTLQPRNNNGGIRMTTTYSSYKLEDNSSYSYSATSDPSSVIFWVRYNTSGESFTYTFQGLEADTYYDFSGLVGWHNNSNSPILTIVLNDGTNNLTTLSKSASAKQTMYSVSSRFKTPSTMTTTTDVKIVFTCDQTGDCMEAISALSLVKVNMVMKDDLEAAIAFATTVDSYLSETDLTSDIATAQGVYDNTDATQTEVNAAVSTLEAAVYTAINKEPLTFINPGFESCTLTTTNAAAVGSTAPMDIAGAWTQTSSASWSSSAVVEYGGAGQVNGVSAPSADNLGNGGYTLGVSVGWDGTVTYKSATATWPIGVYTFTISAYNANSAASQFKSLFGFVPTSGSATLSTKTSFTYDTWETDQVIVTLTEPTEGYIQVGGQAISGGSGSNAKVFFDNITVTYQDPLSGARTIWENAKSDAETAKAENPNVIGVELTTLKTELAKTEPTTIEGFEAATEAINIAKDALVAAAPAYNALATEIAYAQSIGVSTATAEAAQTPEATAETITAATQDLKVQEYNTINTAYPNDVTSLLGIWGTGNYDTTSGQGYAGSETYFDKWNGSAMDMTSSQAVTLPAGQYAVKVAGRGVSTTTMNLSVKVGDADAVSTPFLMIGDTGKGIDTDGATNFSDGGTYSNNNIGRGWQYRYITFTTDGTSEVVISINGHLNANTWQSFYAPVLLCDDATYAPIAVDAAKAELQAAIDAAPAVRTANIGDAVFQVPAAGVQTYSEALSAAQTAHDEAAATVASIEQAKTDLATAIEVYNALKINAPADGQLFNVVLNENGSWTYDGKAATYMAGERSDMGGYNIKYQAAANTNLAQAFTFTKVSGNNYKLSQIDADNNVRYVCTGVPHGGNTSQIRTTTNPDQALLVTVIPTETEGIWNLKNTEANNYIGSQDAGVFTVNSHINFQIVETTKPSIDINTTIAGWGTVMLPFAQTIPSGVKAYTCAEVAGEKLTLVEVTGALEANKPYIIEGSWNESVTGNALGKELTYTEGLLTGTYETMAALNGTYILQKQDEKVGFFQVDTDEAKPNVPANRAYMTISSGVKAFFLGGDADAIQSVFTKVAAGEIFDLAGRKVQKMQKGGVYIIDGKKVSVK